VDGVKLASGETIPAGGVFVYIGFAPNTAYLDGKAKLDERGALITDTALATNLEGVFAAGAIRAGWAGRAAASAGEGATAAIAADTYLKTNA
jgi:thioredoxin reductase (NADPH)